MAGLQLNRATTLVTRLSIILVAGVATSLVACSTSGDMFVLEDVKPWQRSSLARDDMQLINDAMDQAVDEHIYFSREASTGGVVVQGGGCGCN